MAEDPPPVEDRRLELSDLPDDMLMEIFARLPANKLLSVERVSRTWQRCVGPVLNRVEVIVFNNLYYMYEPICSHSQLACDSRPTLFINVENLYYEPDYYSKCFSDFNNNYGVESKIIDAIIRLVSRCSHVKCLDLRRVGFVNFECLMQLIAVFPEFEFLRLGEISTIDDRSSDPRANEVKWRRLAEQLSPKLVHLEICSGFLQDYPSLILAGVKLRSVHLSYSRYFSYKMQLDQLKSRISERPDVEWSLDVEWLSMDYDFNSFDHLTFVFKETTSESRVLFNISYSDNSKVLQVGQFSIDKPFVRKSTIVFKTVERLEMHSVKLEKNIFNCRFERLETLHLINTRTTDDAAFGLLFSSMQQLKKLVILIDEWQAFSKHFPGKSTIALKRLETLEINVCIKQKEQIRMTDLFEGLMLMSSLKIVKLTCHFQQYFVVPMELKKALSLNVTAFNWSFPSTKIHVELRFNKPEFDEEEAIDEVMDWYFSACHFDQISEKYTEEEDFHKVEIKPIESRMCISKVDVVTSIDTLNIHNIAL